MNPFIDRMIRSAKLPYIEDSGMSCVRYSSFIGKKKTGLIE